MDALRSTQRRGWDQARRLARSAPEASSSSSLSRSKRDVQSGEGRIRRSSSGSRRSNPTSRAETLQSRAPVKVPSAAEFFTPSLPSLDDTQSLSLASGYLPARPPAAGSSEPADNAHLYFVLERARHIAKRRRLVIWLNGGPGCSSFDGLMMEIGAFRPGAKGDLEWTIPGGAWNEYADVLYLDQPVGTGFSYVSTSGYVRTLEQAADEVRYFLDRFVEVYPEYAAGNGAETYLAGESFAGQYIPFTASALIKAMPNPINLKGIAIGNGYIDPQAQGGTELEMMVEAKVWDTSRQEYTKVKKYVDSCHAALKKDTQNLRRIDECDNILHHIIDQTKAKTGSRETCINIYDVRLSDEAPACGMNWPPTLQATYDYLSRKDVRNALHVDTKHKPEAWIECSHRVGGPLDDDVTGKASVVKLPEILHAGVKVLLFAGDKDLICNHIGVERVADRLQWDGADWGNPSKKDWYVNNSLAGYWRTSRNLTYVSIADASHMVGVDKPVQAHDMMLRFMDVDLLAAAGPSARISSHLDGDSDRKVLVGGGGGSAQDNRPMIPGVDGKTEEQVAEEAKWAAYYNAGSAALIVLLILVGGGVYVLLRLRRRARLQIGDDRFMAQAEGDEHELDRFIPERGTPGEDIDSSYSDELNRETTALNTRANGRRAGASQMQLRDDAIAQRDSEQIFDVGEESDDDEDSQTRTGAKDASAAQGDGMVRFAERE